MTIKGEVERLMGGKDRMAAMQSALHAKGLDPTLKEMLNALDGDPEHKETELGITMNSILNIMDRKTDRHAPAAAALGEAAGATPKTVRQFEAELQRVPDADRGEWLRKNKNLIKNARVTDVVPNALLKKGSR